jgi:hypothetical protein
LLSYCIRIACIILSLIEKFSKSPKICENVKYQMSLSSVNFYFRVLYKAICYAGVNKANKNVMFSVNEPLTKLFM